ncbi:cobyrinic acid a,c-diamide synthase [Tundrisphaera sp. TA3]|uniref:cobyrinic acid a,c-diamide synthase n=1 Tax=Tundrisphaera sp. TA3 TaxID=3435775 RepID=UPI003EBC6F2B
MMSLPRLALAVSGSGLEPSAASLGLLAGLHSLGWRLQHFRSRACPIGTEAILQATGRPGRHLDAWLMPDDVCRGVFARGADRSQLAIVEGTLDRPASGDEAGCGRPGGLGPLSRSLDLPIISVIDCPRWDRLHLPKLPPEMDAVLLDGLEDASDYAKIASAVSTITRKPVVGAIEALPEARRILQEAPRNRPLPDGVHGPFSASFLRFADLPLLRSLANSRPFPGERLAINTSERARFRVAYALDEAFGRYFPDTLETLEALGAELIEFSPLRSEALPESADLVMIGCGFPDEHADALGANFSLINALRSHVYRGRRIYSEGGGTAYLGRSMRIDGREVPGVGILPFDAERRANPTSPYPVTRTLREDTWLAPRGTVVRGYHSGRWDLKPTSELCHQAAGFGALSDENDFFHHHHAVGGLIHLHLAALPQVVEAFAGPHRPSLTLRRPGR